MWEQIFQAIISSGVWAVLFCGLLVYQLKDSQKRMAEYQTTIDKLSESLKGISQGLDCIHRGMEGIIEVRGIVSEILDSVGELVAKKPASPGSRARARAAKG